MHLSNKQENNITICSLDKSKAIGDILKQSSYNLHVKKIMSFEKKLKKKTDFL